MENFSVIILDNEYNTEHIPAEPGTPEEGA